MTYPIQRQNHRTLPTDWSGQVFVCDVDRTYLSTRFSSLRGLASIPFEFAVDKQDLAGMVTLLKEVRRGPKAASRQTPLYFVSASPHQLRPVIERKMLMDGLEFDGTTFKDWRRTIMALRFGRLREQLGFKMAALLAGRRELPSGAEELLLGDDLEADALAFALYSDVLNRRLSRGQILRVLTNQGVAVDDAVAIYEQGSRLPTAPPAVKRGLVRMERARVPEALLEYAPWVMACAGAFQLAVALLNEGSISTLGVTRVAEDLRLRGVSRPELQSALADCSRRGLASRQTCRDLGLELASTGSVAHGFEPPELEAQWRAAFSKSPHTPWTPARFWQGPEVETSPSQRRMLS